MSLLVRSLFKVFQENPVKNRNLNLTFFRDTPKCVCLRFKVSINMNEAY